MTLTQKQLDWNLTKAINRAARHLTRATPIPAHVPRPRAVTGPCPDCPHGWKHHTAAGHCRTGCPCTRGAQR